MNVLIRKQLNNTINNPIKTLDAKLVLGRELEDDETVIWSFECMSNNASDVTHSTNAPAGVYLYYSPSLTPEIQILLKNEGVFMVKMIAQITEMNDATINVASLDSEGNIIQTPTVVRKSNNTFLESNVIELIYSTDNEWT